MYTEVILKLIAMLASVESSCKASERHLAAILEILKKDDEVE